MACATERHQHRAAADRSVKFFDKSFLRSYIGVGQVGGKLLHERVARHRAMEGVVVFNSVDGGVGIMLGTCAVDKLSLQVCHERTLVVLTHTTRVGHICHIGYFDIILSAEVLHSLTVFGLDHDGHALLRFGNRQFCRVEPRIFGWHTVEIDIQSVRQLADSHADAASTEVVRFLDKAGSLRTTHEALQLALLGGIAFLHLRAARLQRCFGMLLARAGSTTDTITAGASAEQQNDIPCCGRFAAHGIGTHCSDHSAYLETLGGVGRVVNFPHMGGGETYLVAVRGVACCGFAGDDPLRQFARQGVRNRGIDVARTGHAHGLIDIRTARQRVSNGAAQAGACAAERLNLSRVVMGLVFELKQPFLLLSVHIHINKYRAGVVLFALFHIVEQPFLAQVASANSRQLHQAERLLLSFEFFADRVE